MVFNTHNLQCPRIYVAYLSSPCKLGDTELASYYTIDVIVARCRGHCDKVLMKLVG